MPYEAVVDEMIEERGLSLMEKEERQDMNQGGVSNGGK